MTRAATLLLALFLAVLAAALFLAPGRGYWVVDPDSAAYVGLARSLAAGDGYTFQGEPHAKFPPGFPFYLSLAVRVTGRPDCYAAMRDLVCLAGLATVLLAYGAGLKLLRLGPGRALLLAVTAGTSIFLIQYSVSFLRSETLFTALFLGALLAGESWRERGGFGRAALAGLLAAAATLVRVAGGTAILAILGARCLELNPPRARVSPRLLLEVAVFLVAALGPPGAFQARTSRLGAGASPGYADELLQSYALDLTKDIDQDMPRIDAAGWKRRLAENTGVLALSLGKFLVNDNAGANVGVHPKHGALLPSGVLLLLLLALGWASSWRRNLVLVTLLVPAYVALHLVWPFNQQQRFYLPVQPLFLCLLAWGAAVGLRLALALASRRPGRFLLAAAAVALTALLAARRSVAPQVLDRWSTKYALLLLAAAALALFLLFLALSLRGRALDRGRWFERSARATLGLFLLLSCAQAARFLLALMAEHDAFLAGRAAEPVPAAYARLKGLPAMFTLFDVLARHAGPDDLVMSDIPKMIHVCTGLRTVPFEFSSREQTIRLDHPRGRVTFLYFSREIPQACAVFDAARARAPDRFEVLYEFAVAGGEPGQSVCLLRVRS